MFDPYTQNAFRVLGLAAETDPALLPTEMHPRHLPPLWKISWLANPNRSPQAVEEALARLRDPLHYRTWFRKLTAVDERAFKAIEDGYWEGAADLWRSGAEAGDEASQQNMLVLYHSRAVATSGGTTPVWAYWTRALEWCNKLTVATADDPACVALREHMVEDLVKLAHEQASRNSPEDVRLVLDIFRRAGLPQAWREQVEEDLLSLELSRLRHSCNRIKDSLPSAFRVGDHLSERNAENFQRQLESQIYPMLEWIARAQPGGELESRARQEVALLLRSLSRAVRGKVESGDLGFMARAVEIAPEGFHRELLDGQDGPVTPAASVKASEILEDTYRRDPSPEETGRPARRFPALQVAALLLLIVAGLLTAAMLEGRKQALARQRASVQAEWSQSVDEAAKLAADLAAVRKKIDQSRGALQKAAPSERKRIQTRLDRLSRQQTELEREHREALFRLASLKDKLAGIK